MGAQKPDPKNPVSIIYHKHCADGFAAAWVAWRFFRDRKQYEVAFLAANYNDPPPDVEGRDVVIIDFSYPRSVLLSMKEHANSLWVLDHHKSAEADLQGLPFCTFDSERAGCMMAFNYFYPEWKATADRVRVASEARLFDDEERYIFTRWWPLFYVEDRDLWRWQLHQTREVNAHLGTIPFSFVEWEKTFLDGPEHCATAGESVLLVRQKYVDDMLKLSYPIRFDIYDKIPCVNVPWWQISDILNLLARDKPFAVGWFRREDGNFSYSLRSVGDFDVSELAKKYGGGGHKNAAGFICAEPIYVLEKVQS